MSDKELREKEDVLIQLYIKEWITKTQYFEMMERIKKEK